MTVVFIVRLHKFRYYKNKKLAHLYMDKKDDKPQDAAAPAQSEEDINSLENLSEGNDKDAATTEEAPADAPAPKHKKKGIKRILGFFNVYLVAFIFLFIVGAAVT